MKTLLILTTTLLAFSVSIFAQDAPKKAQPKKKRKPPAVFVAIEDDPKLPRVLLLGDSISIGYTLSVRELLKGKANVHRAPTNCGPTIRGLEQIDAWLGEGKWDVIHFNWGLHDLKYMGPNGGNLADPKNPASHQQVPPADYEKNLRTLVKRLKKTGAKLIWCSTTPYPDTVKGRVAADAMKYNAIAAKVMAEEGVSINDLHGYCVGKLAEIQQTANVHFTKDGSAKLAGVVAKVIGWQLQK